MSPPSPDRARARYWEKLGYGAVEELIGHLPRRYEDRSRWCDPFQAVDGEEINVRGTLDCVKLARWRGGRCRFEARLKPEGADDTLRLVWYNMPFLRTSLTTGKVLAVFGRLESGDKERTMTHPEFEVIHDAEDPNIHLNRIPPVYPLVAGVGQRQLRRSLFKLIFEKNLRGPVADSGSEPDDGMDTNTAWRAVHFPESWDELEAARRRLAWDELLVVQLLLARRRRRATAAVKIRAPTLEGKIRSWLDQLPFRPTDAQLRVFDEIAADLQRPTPMNRLLQGDVGSGKTLVAAHAMILNAAAGAHAALLAPTETLALQHTRNLAPLLQPHGIQIRTWTAAQKSPTAGRGPQVLVGTHALLQDNTALPPLGLAVIDEQHKFGVRQRMALLSKGDHPDLLVMSATPIPRTLCLTLYGDLDVSILDQLPPGRRPVRTVVRSREALPKVWDYIRAETARGHQAYVVHPVLEDSETSALKSARAGHRELCELFGPGQVVLLHGQLDSDEKAARMKRFVDKQARVMVATSVIEVGVDVPDATVMVVEHAARFGLAQLHQLRGRVGRGGHDSYCVLVDDGDNPDARQRLQLLEQTGDGFRIAEADLEWRGPGNILGTEQSGLPRLRLARWPRDLDLLPAVRTRAREIDIRDPRLKCHRNLHTTILRLEQDTASSLD